MIRSIAVMAILVSLLPVYGAAGDGVRRVSAVEFRGLKLLTKFDIIKGARLKAVDGGMVIDVPSLEKALSRNKYLRGFGVSERAGRLIVTIEEKKPSMILVIARGGASAIYELDEGHAILSRNDLHAASVPVLCVAGRDLGNGAGRRGVGNILSLLDRVKKNNAPVYRELSDISYRGDSLRVYLRGRKTRFILKPEEADFMKLRYIAGQCDRTETYPEEIIISDDAAIIR